jgi:hypothetical protein
MFTLKKLVRNNPNTRRKQSARELQKLTGGRAESKILAFA